MMEKIYDIAFEVDGGGVQVEQDAGCGEVHTIALHKIHVAHLAELLGLLKPDSPANLQTTCLLERENATLRRRMRTLHRKIAELDGYLWSVPSFPPSAEVSQDCRMSEALLELCDEFLSDLDVMSAPTPEPVDQRRETQPEPTGYREGTHNKPKGSLQLELEAAP